MSVDIPAGVGARSGDGLRTALCEAAWSAGHCKDRYLPAQYRRFLRRCGKKNENKATFAVAHTLIVIVWHVLHDGRDDDDLGGDYFGRRNDATARQRYLGPGAQEARQHRHPPTRNLNNAPITSGSARPGPPPRPRAPASRSHREVSCPSMWITADATSTLTGRSRPSWSPIRRNAPFVDLDLGRPRR